MDGDRRITYAKYLRLDDLLRLQDASGLRIDSIEGDELHFIIVHQVSELWFKLTIQELTEVRDLMHSPSIEEHHVPLIVHHLERVAQIFRLLADQWDVMATMKPMDFLEFREGLGRASGFESHQMRSIEVLLGVTPDLRGGPDPIDHLRALVAEGSEPPAAMRSLQQLVEGPNLNQVLRAWLSRTPIDGSRVDEDRDESTVRAWVDRHLDTMAAQGQPSSSIDVARAFLAPDGKVDRARAGLLYIETYRELPLLAWPRRLIEGFIDLEAAIVLFRTHHARMVERMIGRRSGTGGSPGVEYLDSTTRMRVFTDLWEVRTHLVRRSLHGEPGRPDAYGFNIDQSS